MSTKVGNKHYRLYQNQPVFEPSGGRQKRDDAGVHVFKRAYVSTYATMADAIAGLHKKQTVLKCDQYILVNVNTDQEYTIQSDAADKFLENNSNSNVVSIKDAKPKKAKTEKKPTAKKAKVPKKPKAEKVDVQPTKAAAKPKSNGRAKKVSSEPEKVPEPDTKPTTVSKKTAKVKPTPAAVPAAAKSTSSTGSEGKHRTRTKEVILAEAKEKELSAAEASAKAFEEAHEVLDGTKEPESRADYDKQLKQMKPATPVRQDIKDWVTKNQYKAPPKLEEPAKLEVPTLPEPQPVVTKTPKEIVDAEMSDSSEEVAAKKKARNPNYLRERAFAKGGAAYHRNRYEEAYYFLKPYEAELSKNLKYAFNRCKEHVEKKAA